MRIRFLFAFAATLLPAFAFGQDAVEPLLILDHSEYAKGEAILFKAGRQSRELVDPMRLMKADCRLSVYASDGTELFSNSFAR